ncbi:MAG: membrane dipeptidase [Pseudomonadota bacterium]
MTKPLLLLILLLLLHPTGAAPKDAPRPVVDLHCDTLTQLEQAPRTDIVRTRDAVSLKSMQAGGTMAQVFAIWTNPKRKDAMKVAQRQVSAFRDQILGAAGDAIRQARSYADILENHRDGTISAILAMEGANGLGDDASNLAWYAQQGLRILSLTWNNSNAFADGRSAPDPPPRGGLTEEGARLLGIMATNLIIADLSHAHWETFWDIVTRIPGPVIATHANARGVRDHDRNLDDEQIVAIARKRGVIGLILYPEFISAGKVVTPEDLWSHYRYIADLVGPEFLALGSDFGRRGAVQIEGVKEPGDVPVLLDAFRHQGLEDPDLDLLASGNALEVLRIADEQYFDIPRLDWRPLRPQAPIPSDPALYDRLSSTSVTVCHRQERFEFDTGGTDLFALALRVGSGTPLEVSVHVTVRTVSCQGEELLREFSCPADGSRCLLEIFGDGGSAGPCASHVSLQLELPATPVVECCEVQDIVPLQRVVFRGPEDHSER